MVVPEGTDNIAQPGGQRRRPGKPESLVQGVEHTGVIHHAWDVFRDMSTEDLRTLVEAGRALQAQQGERVIEVQMAPHNPKGPIATAASTIFLTVMSLNFLGDWLRDRLDPRLRQI